MNEKLKKLFEAINAKKQEVKDLVDAGRIEDATTAKAALKDMQDSFNLIYDLEEQQTENVEDAAKKGDAKVITDKKTNAAKAFVNAIKAAVFKTALDDEDAAIINSMKEGTPEDGGLVVPQDISTQIKELRRGSDALETIVNVEPVNTLSGTRVIERNADTTPFDNVDEAAEFPEISNPQFDNIDYKVKKKGGILKVTNELLNDTAEAVLNYLRNWIAKKSKATRNALIIKAVDDMTTGSEVTVSTLDDLKRVFNVSLDPAIAAGAAVVTNQTGYNWLDTLKDDNGRYVLQPNPADPTTVMLFGQYPIIKLSNKTLKDDAGKAVIYCGDFKEAVTLFDREKTTIEISNVAGDFWAKDLTGIKVRERLDVKAVDTEAVVKCYVATATDLDGNGKYSEAELNALSKAEILELAAQLKLTLTKTAADSKADIIADFIKVQG